MSSRHGGCCCDIQPRWRPHRASQGQCFVDILCSWSPSDMLLYHVPPGAPLFLGSKCSYLLCIPGVVYRWRLPDTADVVRHSAAGRPYLCSSWPGLPMLSWLSQRWRPSATTECYCDIRLNRCARHHAHTCRCCPGHLVSRSLPDTAGVLVTPGRGGAVLLRSDSLMHYWPCVMCHVPTWRLSDTADGFRTLCSRAIRPRGRPS